MSGIKAGKKKSTQPPEKELLMFNYDLIAREAGESTRAWISSIKPEDDYESELINRVMALAWELGGLKATLLESAAKEDRIKWIQAVHKTMKLAENSYQSFASQEAEAS